MGDTKPAATDSSPKIDSPSPSPSSSPSSPFLSSSTSTPSTNRLWRPAAQRNLRNQWSHLASLRRKWASASSDARLHATSLVSNSLSQRYMDAMELGALSDMPNIRNKACCKLFKQEVRSGEKLLSSYKDMLDVVTQMVNASRSMRCFLKGTSSSSLVQFSRCSENENDAGDGGGVPVFSSLSVLSFEELARELVQMFLSELKLKRLLVMEFLSIRSKEVPQPRESYWLEEIYEGEFDSLITCNLYSRKTCTPLLPKLECQKLDGRSVQSNSHPGRDVLQVYLTSWLAEVNVDKNRVDEIFGMVGEEMRITFS